MLPILPLLLIQASAILLPNEGCRYRKVYLKREASLLETPVEGWLTLDGKPCNPSSRFHWRPSVVAPTVSYAPVEVSKWASAADRAAGTPAHQKEYLKAQGLNVTEDEIRKALDITTVPPVTTLAVTTTPAQVGGLPAGILDQYSPGHISVNVTDADRFVQDARMMQKIKEILANRTGLNPDYLRINYTKLHDNDAPITSFLQSRRAGLPPLDVVEAGITASIPKSDKDAAEKWQSVKENDLYKAVQDAYKEIVQEDRLAVRYSPTPTDAETVAQVVSRLQETAATATTSAFPTAAPTTAPAAPAAQAQAVAAPAEAKLVPTTAPKVPGFDVFSTASPAAAPQADGSSSRKPTPTKEAKTQKQVGSPVEKLEKKLDTLTKTLGNTASSKEVFPSTTSSAPTSEAGSQMEKLENKLDTLTKTLSNTASSKEVFPSTTSSAITSEAGSQMEKLEKKLDTLTKTLSNTASSKEVFPSTTSSAPTSEAGSQMEKLENKLDKLTKTLSNTIAPTATPVQKHIDSLNKKVEKVAQQIASSKEVFPSTTSSAPASEVGSQMEKLENKLDKLTKTLSNTAPVAAPAPAPAPAVALAPTTAPVAAPAAAQAQAVAAAPAEAKLVPTTAPKVPGFDVFSTASPAAAPQADGSSSRKPTPTEEAKTQKQVGSPVEKLENKLDKLTKTLSNTAPVAAPAPAPAPAVAPPKPTPVRSFSEEAQAKMEQIEDKIDRLSQHFRPSAVAKALEPAKAFKNSQVAQAAQVELMDVKTDVQQEILTHALDGKAKMHGQVEAANHQRNEILQKLNVTMAKRLSKARESLNDAESQVTETARHVVQQVVDNVTAEFGAVKDVGKDAETLKMEAESLQNNISSLLSHVQHDSGLAAEMVAQLPDSEQVASEVQAIKADVKDIHVEAEKAEAVAGESLATAETAMQVLNRSDVMAHQARDLKLRAAKQAAENRAKILEIAKIFG